MAGPVAGPWMLEALTSEFADLTVSLTTICTRVGVRNVRTVAFPVFVPWPPSFELFSSMGGSAHAEQLLLQMICGPGLRRDQCYVSDGQSKLWSVGSLGVVV